MVAGTSTVKVGRSCAMADSRCVGREARMDRHRRPKMQRRRGLDVEAADMEERKHGEDVIAGGEAVHMPGSLRRSRARPPAAAPRPWAFRWCRTYKRQQRAGEIGMRVAAIAARAFEQRIETPVPWWERNQARRQRCWAGVLPAREESPQKPVRGPSTLTEASDRMNNCSPPPTASSTAPAMAPSRAQA